MIVLLHFIRQLITAELPLKLRLIDVIPTRGFVDRKTTEAVVQSIEPSEINRRIEGERTVGNLYL